MVQSKAHPPTFDGFSIVTSDTKSVPPYLQVFGFMVFLLNVNIAKEVELVVYQLEVQWFDPRFLQSPCQSNYVKSCLLGVQLMEPVFQHRIDYGVTLGMLPLDSVYHVSIHCIKNTRCLAHHFALYVLVSWPSLMTCRRQH